METLWPWLAVAGIGALHGLSPANGWMFAAAWGVQARDQRCARRALLPIAIGHAVSVALVAYAVTLGLSLDRSLVQALAGALLVGAALRRVALRNGARSHRPISAPTGHAAMALWAFLMATAHGAGLMLVPTLMPLCLTQGPAAAATASGTLAPALAAICLHTLAMLATTGLVATGMCRGIAALGRGRMQGLMEGAWTVALAITGGLLIGFR